MTANASADLKRMLGEPGCAIRSMLLPIMVSYLVIRINSFADAAWCSGLGPDAAAAMSAVSPMCWIITGLGAGVEIGVATAISRCLGRREYAMADGLATQALVLSAIIGMVLAPALILCVGPAVRLMGAGEVMDLCKAYIYPQILGGALVIMSRALAGIMRAEGAAIKSMVVILSGVAVNIILDPLMIYGLDMGLAGAGAATALSYAVPIWIALRWYKQGKFVLVLRTSDARVTMSSAKAIFAVGIPRSVESIVNSIMVMFQSFFVIASGGILALMYFNLVWKFVSASQVLSRSVGSALIPVCSAALGEGDKEKAREGYRYSMDTTLFWMTVIAAALFVFADVAVMPFTYAPSMAEHRDGFAHVLRIYALMIPFAGMLDVGSSILQSLRKSQISALTNFARNCLALVLLCFCGSISPDAIYWSLVLAEAFGALAMLGLAKIAVKRCRVECYRCGCDKVIIIRGVRGAIRCDTTPTSSSVPIPKCTHLQRTASCS